MKSKNNVRISQIEHAINIEIATSPLDKLRTPRNDVISNLKIILQILGLRDWVACSNLFGQGITFDTPKHSLSVPHYLITIILRNQGLRDGLVCPCGIPTNNQPA